MSDPTYVGGRIVYRTDLDAVLILDAFVKKTEQTPQSDCVRMPKAAKEYDDA